MIFKKNPPLSYMILFSSLMLCCSEFIVDADKSQSNIEHFEQSWEFVNTVYPYFELKGVEWDKVYDFYKLKAEKADGDEIFPILLDMIGELKDGHTYIKTAGGHKIYAYTPSRRIKDQYTYSPTVVRTYFDENLIVSAIGGLEYGLTKNNIGYIYISSFGSAFNFKGNFQAAMNYTKSADGLIIDVRHNKGGDGVNANYVVSRFIEKPLTGMNSYVLGIQSDNDSIQPSAESRYQNKVVVLTNGVTYSAAESFAEMMKQVKNVTVIGDTTGGGSAGYYGINFPASGDLKLANGILVHVGTMDIRKYDDLPFENIGICPDLLVEQSEKDIDNDRDLQLETALELLRE